jgi:hypothetical protein
MGLNAQEASNQGGASLLYCPWFYHIYLLYLLLTVILAS